MKTYVYTYRDGAGCGKRYITAENEAEALNRLKMMLEQYHPTRKYKIDLEQVLDM